MKKGEWVNRISWKPELEDASEYTEDSLVEGFVQTAPYRYFWAEIHRVGLESNCKLGLQVVEVENIVRVCQVSKRDDNAITLWNDRCKTTYPDDMIQAGDYIVSVNDIRESATDMVDELWRFSRGKCDELLLVIHRDEPWWGCAKPA